MGIPSPLWGWEALLIYTQNNTRRLRTETSPLGSPVIALIHPKFVSYTHILPLHLHSHYLKHITTISTNHLSLPNTHQQLHLLPILHKTQKYPKLHSIRHTSPPISQTT